MTFLTKLGNSLVSNFKMLGVKFLISSPPIVIKTLLTSLLMIIGEISQYSLDYFAFIL